MLIKFPVPQFSFVWITLMIITACNNSTDEKSVESKAGTTKAGIKKADFGTVDGKPVYLYTLTNAKGDEVKITNYGGTVTSWTAPDKNGKRTSIVLGFDSLGADRCHRRSTRW